MHDLYRQMPIAPVECPHPDSEWSRIPLVGADERIQRGWECFICGWVTPSDPKSEQTDIAAEVQADLARTPKPTDLVRIRVLERDLPPFKHQGHYYKSRVFASQHVVIKMAPDAADAILSPARRIGSSASPLAYDISVRRSDLENEPRPYTVVQSLTPRRWYNG